LTNINLAIEKGEFVGVMGPSGSGKTTLLNLIATIDEPTTGQILIEGNNPYQLNPNDLAKFRRQALGFVFQDYNLLETLNIKENISLPLTIEGQKVNDTEGKADSIAHTLNMLPIIDKCTFAISGGQAQCAAIARAKIHQPNLLRADAPTVNLDSKAAKESM